MPQQPHTATLNDILITEELSGRAPRTPNWQAQAQAMQLLAHQMASNSQTLLQNLVDITLDLCIAGSAGVSLLETTPTGEEVFRWNVLAGALAQYVGDTTPRNFSPCGVTLERGTPQLFCHPEWYFTYLQTANTPIVEGLVLPLIADRHVFGTIWIMLHSQERHFDLEDVRIMTSLADFTATALLLQQHQTGELLAANVALETEIAERKQAQERARALISNLPGGAAFVVDHNLRYLLAEGEALAIAKFKREDFVGRTIFEVLPSELATTYEPMYRKALAGEPFEHEHYAHDRSYISRGTPLRAENGEIYAVLAVSYDITERKQAEVALRESEEKYRGLFDSIDVGFCIIEVLFDPQEKPFDYRFLEANPAFIAQTGLTNAIGRTALEFAPEHETFWFDIYGEIALTGKPARFEHQAEALSSYRWYEVYAFRIGEPEKRHVAVLFTDITERVRIEDDRQRAQANLAFLAEISQDLAGLTNIDETINALGEKIGGYFNLSAYVFAELSETAEIAVIDYTWQLSHMPSFIGTYRMQDFVTPEVLQLCRAGEAVVIRNVFDDPLVDGEQYAALNIGSFLSIPLVRDGEWRFLLVIYHSEPYDWRDDEIELTHELANRIWTRLERARAEELLRRAAQMDAFRVKLSDALRSLSDAVEIQATVTRTTMNFFEADRCYYCEIIDGSAIIRRDASQAGLPSVVGAYPLENSPIFRAMLDAGQPFVFQDVHTTKFLDENLRQTCLQLQIVSGMNVPVIKQGEPVGILTITQSTPRNWTAFEMDLAEEIADRTWATIERTRAEAALREAELERVREQSAREQERQRAESLAELDRAKTLFFSNVSHEFRTPLTLILAPVQDALSDSANPLPRVQRERLELAHRNTLRLLKLVNTLLDFSRIEAGRMKAVYEPTDLATYTTELASVFRSAIEQAGLRLVVDCPPLAESVYVDRQMWEKIVLNLLSNAFKFTFDGEIAVRLHLVDDHHVKLQVQDTGTGIEPEQLPYIMKRFYQVRAAKARTHEGSGIGLALVHELIKLHGGTLDVTSTPGVGSCFTVTIPLGTAHLPNVSVSEAVATSGASAGRDSARHLQLDVGDRTTVTHTLTSTGLGVASYVQEAERWIVEEGQRGKGKGKKDSSPPSPLPLNLSPYHILIVDDNADMRDYLTRILSEHVQVQAVADGVAALAAVNERVPDLILSDVMMPGLDGFELLKTLRTSARTKEIPIILLSARAGEEFIVEGLLAGADDYLIKPFSANELVTRVNAYLQMADMRSQALHQERTINRRKDEVLSVVSHELNTPLVAILGWTRLLRSNLPSPAMLSKALETIERNATLQAKLVQDLLDMSRITVGKISLNLEPVQLQGVIDQAIATVQQSLQTKDIHLDSQLTPSPVTVQGDSERLQQIILNLLTNAVKFTPTDGKVEVNLNSHENQAVIVISDTGCGIDAEFLPYIFDTFSQAPSTKKGLGLGLAISRSLVQLHGGTITAQSPGIGQGTTFTINLPL